MGSFLHLTLLWASNSSNAAPLLLIPPFNKQASKLKSHGSAAFSFIKNFPDDISCFYLALNINEAVNPLLCLSLLEASVDYGAILALSADGKSHEHDTVINRLLPTEQLLFPSPLKEKYRRCRPTHYQSCFPSLKFEDLMFLADNRDRRI